MGDIIAAIWDNKFLLSVILIATMLAIRVVAVHTIRSKAEILSDAQRLWISRFKNVPISLILLGLTAIWASELRDLALSITAIAVALVIATKELILCISGAFLRTSSGAFSVGDWIELGGHTGEVIDQNILSVTIQEIDIPDNNYEYTGRTVIVPNSLLLMQPAKNLNFLKRYVFHRFDVTLDASIDTAALGTLILDKAKMYCADFADVAKRYNQFVEKRAGIDLADPEPRLRISTNDNGKLVLGITVFCPTRKAVEIEQLLTGDVLAFAHGDYHQSAPRPHQPRALK